MTALRTVLAYGDSNTHGAPPDQSLRLAPEVRWPGVMATELGSGYTVIEEGLNGRTTSFDDPIEPHRNGLTYLTPCLMTHRPLDLVILMLGTNALKRRFSLSASEIAKSVEPLIQAVRQAEYKTAPVPDILLVAPPLVAAATAFDDQFTGAHEKSKGLGAAYLEVAGRLDCRFFDAATIIEPSPQDGVHFEPEAHRTLGQALAGAVRQALDA